MGADAVRKRVARLIGFAVFGFGLATCGGDSPTAPAPTPPPPVPSPPAQPQPPPAPPAPTGLHVSATTPDSITWTWTAVEGATAYMVQVSVDEVFDDTDAVVTTTEVSYTVTGLSPESGRRLRVRAVAGTAEAPVESAWSSPVAGMSAMPPPPPVPTGLHVSATTPDSITWTW
ncbi:MAG: fibronectin type III domain-containing protein, partial [Acidobacteria bacterium]|nr:fibronectin type III domain-containing protein [Acidobacteriota bacterium]